MSLPVVEIVSNQHLLETQETVYAFHSSMKMVNEINNLESFITPSIFIRYRQLSMILPNIQVELSLDNQPVLKQNVNHLILQTML